MKYTYVMHLHEHVHVCEQLRIHVCQLTGPSLIITIIFHRPEMGIFDKYFKKKPYKKGWSSGNSQKYGYQGSTVRDAGHGTHTLWRNMNECLDTSLYAEQNICKAYAYIGHINYNKMKVVFIRRIMCIEVDLLVVLFMIIITVLCAYSSLAPFPSLMERDEPPLYYSFKAGY